MTIAGVLSGTRLLDNSTPDAKLETITTANKVANSATTATNANTPNAIVARDGSGNFSAGTITATFSGDGSALTNLNANQLTAGTVPVARLPLATGAAAGAVTIGSNITVASGVISLTSANVTTALGYTPLNKAGDTMTGALILNADPTAALGAATKQYVDAAASGLQVKASCRVASITALAANTYANGSSGVGATLTATANAALSIDGIAVAVGDRVLVAGEATQSHNGIYTVTNAGSGSAAWVLTRATDADGSTVDGVNEVKPGMFTFVDDGTANKGSGWVLVGSGAITIGTTSLVFTQFSGAGEITAGNGLTKSGNTISVLAADTTINVSASGVKVNATVAGTANQIVLRDANGRAQMVDPSAPQDIATKNYVDNATGVNGTIVTGEVPTGTIDGTNATFTLAHTPKANSLEVFVGTLRFGSSLWSLTGTTLTMNSGYQPQVGEDFEVNYRY